MLETYKKHIKYNLPFLNEGKLLIAISGGLDSVVLTHLCHQSKLNIALAHCNFNLRDNESDLDEAFVIDLAEQLNLEVFTQHFNTESYAKDEKISIQIAARELRYNWFEALANQLQFEYILTAHHADDNLETFLINLTRGTGLDGLTGIPETNNTIVRPLLSFTRAEIESYAQETNLNWREDSSNRSNKYLRNALRLEVIPKLKELNANLLDNFKKTISNLKDTADIVDESLNAVAKRAIVDIDDNSISFKISEFKKVNNPKAYLFEMFKAYEFTEWNDVLALLDAQSGKRVYSTTHSLLKDREHLILSEKNNAILNKNEESLSISETDFEVETSLGILKFEETQQLNNFNESTIYVDKDLLNFPLLVRHWKKGDYFYPLGMQGKKKLSKFFKDEKLSLVAKENSLLLCSGDAIVWVMNQRADNRFRVTDQTKTIIKITIDAK